MHTYAGGETNVITGTAEAPNLNWIGFINPELHPEEDCRCRSLSEVLSLISGPDCKSTLSYRSSIPTSQELG